MSKLSQMFPPKATFTEASLGDLSGKVYLITGSNTGVGKELARILYSKNATVHIAARSAEKAHAAIDSIRAACPSSTGTLEFLALDLADLTAVAQAARTFLATATRLDVLFNNAGVMHPPPGSVSKQGYELQLAVHNLGHGLLADMLAPLLARTAAEEQKQGRTGTVRVAWASSLYMELGIPDGGFYPDNIDYKKKDLDTYAKYSISKAGTYYQASEYAKRHQADGIVSVALNPGNLKSDLQRNHGCVWRTIMGVILYPAVNGAYTELFAGLSPNVTADVGLSGKWVVPFGRVATPRADLVKGTKSTTEGGSGMGEQWYDWCLEQVSKHKEA